MNRRFTATPPSADRIIRNYRRAGRSLGALASGDKGMGKSLLMRVLADRFTSELNLPVVLVEGDHPGIADFLDMLPECMVVFDEFEKTFAPSGDEEDEPRFAAQQQFLGLFDGLSATKRLYVLTVNNVKNIDEHLVNRPGRLHHHLRFTYPSTAEVRAYLNDADTPPPRSTRSCDSRAELDSTSTICAPSPSAWVTARGSRTSSPT